MPTLLNSSLFLGEHANIIRVHRPKPSLVRCTRMVYIHDTRLPAGKPLPMQCEECRCLYTWKVQKGSNEFYFRLVCQTIGCKNIVEGSFAFNMQDYKVVKGTGNSRDGAWYYSEQDLKM